MQAINSTIVDLTGIFQQLATMVSEQGEQVARIDSHVATTVCPFLSLSLYIYIYIYIYIVRV